MTVTRLTIAVGVLVYVGLWALAIAGASSLVPLLLIPPVLAVLVAGGSWLTSYMGVPTRAPKFRHPDDDEP